MVPSAVLSTTFALFLGRALLALSVQPLVDVNSSLLTVINPFSAQLDPNNTLAIVEGAFPFLPSNNPTAGVRIPAGWSFSIGFQSLVSVADDTLQNGSPRLYFGAAVHSGDNSISELPPWLDFANDTLTFSGTAPAQTSINGTVNHNASQIVQSLRILVYCATSPSRDISTWYTSDDFQLIVVRHVLEMKSRTIEIGSTARRSVAKDLESLLGSVVTIDGHGVSNLSSIHLELDFRNQSWLHWDSTAFSLSGIAPDNFINGAIFSVPAQLLYRSCASSFLVNFEVDPFPFTAFDYPEILIHPHTMLNASLSALLRDPLRYQYSLPYLNPGWLEFNTQTYILSGTAPTIPHDVSSIPITLMGRDSRSGLTSNVTLHLVVDFRKTESCSSTPIKWPILLAIVFGSALIVGLFVAAALRKKSRAVKRSITDAVKDMHPASPFNVVLSDDGKGTILDGPVEEAGANLVESPAERPVASPGDVGLLTSHCHSQTSIHGLFNGPSLRSLGPRAMGFMPSMNFSRLLHGVSYAEPSRRLESTPTAAQSFQPSVQSSFSQLSGMPSACDSTSSWDRESQWLENKRLASRNAFWRRGDFSPGPLDD